MPGAPAYPLASLDATGFLRWAVLVRASFAARRAEIDALNVFPVPDGDTGTNLYLTLDAALDQARQVLEHQVPRGRAPLSDLCREMSRAMLLTARGNSGVILSQVFRGIADHVMSTGAEELDGPGLAQALQAADRLAWEAVAEPTEGTILSVSRAVATACAAALDADPHPALAELVSTVTAVAEAALQRTPTQLPALARAGVLDAGGAGYLLFLEGLYRAIHGAPYAPERPLRRRAAWTTAPQDPGPAAHPQGSRGPAGPAYEVQYLLTDTDEARVAALRERLAALGESVLVVGAEGTWNVHAHVDHPGAAVEVGIEAGRPHQVVITHFEDRRADPGHTERPAVAVLACAPGPGIADVLRAAGAHVVRSGPGGRASAGQLLAAVRATGAAAVLMLPDDVDTEPAALAAARAAAPGHDVRVVPSARTAVQGLAALAVFDREASLEVNLQAMTEAAAATRHGAVTVAGTPALTTAGWCHAGDVLGLVAGDVVVIGTDLYDVAGQVVHRLLADGGELLTVLSGDGAPADLAPTVAAAARLRHRDLEVTTIPGLQPHCPLLLGVE